MYLEAYQTAQFLTVCITIILGVQSNPCVERFYKRQRSKDNLLFSGGGSTGVYHGLSKTHCLIQCGWQNTCTVALYNHVIGICRLYTRVGEGTTQFGWQYYGVLCPLNKGYVMDKNLWMCFKFHSNPASEPVTKETCLREGGTLIRIDSKMKQKFFVQNFQHGFIDGELVAGRWVYSDGSVMVYKAFRRGEPNGSGDCILSRYDGWNDVPCSVKISFVCEIPI